LEFLSGALDFRASSADGADVIIGALVLVGLIGVMLRGGRLAALAELRPRLIGVAVAAFAVQVVVVNVLPGGSRDVHAIVLMGTYGVLALIVVANLRVPGLPLIGLGGLLNALAIVANGGVMPAARGALRMAGCRRTLRATRTPRSSSAP
jgi:hypothetical protein